MVNHQRGVPHTDFPYDELDRDDAEGSDELTEDAASIADAAQDILLDMDVRRRLMENPAIRVLVSDMLGKVLNIIRTDKRSRLAADCLVISIGGDLKEDGTTMSMTELARDHGMTKAAISKRVKELRRRLDLPTNRYLKSDASRRKYALTNARPIRLGADA